MARRTSDGQILIAVIGVTGAGKTTFISKASGRNDLEIGHDIDSCTRDVIPVTFNLDKQKVTLIDTPGFDDSDKSDSDILGLVASYMAKTYENGILLTGVIFLQPISQPRLQGSEMKRTRVYKKLLGEDAYERVVIATTMWSHVAEKEATSRQNQRKNRPDVWGDMVAKGAKVVRHDNNRPSALEIVRMLSKFTSPVELQVQKELIETHGRIGLTSAGKQLDADLSETIMKLKEEINDLRQERTETASEIKALNNKIIKYEKEQVQLENSTACGDCTIM
ncbi:P-loop containing nucleoside triphosphate hydrolase protein [Ilyonectria robusta]|uniref:P-loop containing nucleoside triphosphate hydrolase protein n=1 Tax=Ilyonectria robusta TaxID=1079257 RepID=UPI001E8D2D97|nr:P-loop containing nucleoside triphosphate hydrolase protein [Ilyonectria robusta]KAH8645555.1 P-loop containing nucleoside triphosphate hydrolase protein [Ilyonectria robusta]